MKNSSGGPRFRQRRLAVLITLRSRAQGRTSSRGGQEDARLLAPVLV